MIERNMMASSDAIALMVSRLSLALQPNRIILFGSHGRGTAGPESDVDLLIVMDHVDDTRKAMVAAMRIVSDIPIPKDIIVTDSQRLTTRSKMQHTIEAAAMREGREVYVA